jgi:transcriptional regulator with XRE-family HTH domain
MLLNRRKFGQYLAAARVRVNLSQNELASRLGYSSPQFISNWERGESCPPLNKLRPLARELKIPIDEMVGRIVNETEAFLKSELISARSRRALKTL